MKINSKFHYTKQEILESARIGIEIEFFSMLKNVQIIRQLSKEFGVKVVLPLDVNTFNEKKPKYHSSVEPSANLFKLEIDNSGGPKMKELITGPMNYDDAKKIIIKMLNWIKINGWTTEKSSIHINVSFDDWKINLPISISGINKLKLALDIDENYIYKRFPIRKDNVYARSVKDIFVNNIFYYVKNANSISINQFKIPTEKYYGINFKKVNDDYVEFRYLGGEKYEEKQKEIFECLDYFIFLLYENVINTELSSSQIENLRKITSDHKKILDSYKDPIVFKRFFPDINVFSDMFNHDEILKTQWHNFRDKLFELIILGKIKKGDFNYDSDFNTFQLKKAKVDGIELNGFEFLDCDLMGHFENCSFFNCKIHNAIVKHSTFNSDNEVLSSKVEECVLYTHNVIEDSYIDNKKLVINCKVKGGVIRSGVKGKNTEISKETEIVDLSEN